MYFLIESWRDSDLFVVTVLPSRGRLLLKSKRSHVQLAQSKDLPSAHMGDSSFQKAVQLIEQFSSARA